MLENSVDFHKKSSPARILFYFSHKEIQYFICKRKKYIYSGRLKWIVNFCTNKSDLSALCSNFSLKTAKNVQFFYQSQNYDELQQLYNLENDDGKKNSEMQKGCKFQLVESLSSTKSFDLFLEEQLKKFHDLFLVSAHEDNLQDQKPENKNFKLIKKKWGVSIRNLKIRISYQKFRIPKLTNFSYKLKRNEVLVKLL